MIVRILSGGQFRVDGEILERIKSLDDDLMVAVQQSDEERFHCLLAELVTVARQGQALRDSELVESDLILPHADMTLDEAKQLFEDHMA